MFSFHKPRVYRSGLGCCICRAKSSSSRFTDSKRYEEDFYDCFKLDEKRTGEICNACVLLVKRWKKLPRGSGRNWQHVVDARAGHGSKPMSKIKKVKKSNEAEESRDIEDKKEFFIPKVLSRNVRESSPSGFSDDITYCISNGSGSYDSSLAASPVPSPEQIGGLDQENGLPVNSSRQENNNNTEKQNIRGRLKRLPRKNLSINSSFLDLDFWKREKTCCGIIFKGPCGEVLLDPRFLNPCFCRSGTTSPASISPQSDTIPDSNCFPSCQNGIEDSGGGELRTVNCVAPNGNDKVLMNANRFIPTPLISD